MFYFGSAFGFIVFVIILMFCLFDCDYLFELVVESDYFFPFGLIISNSLYKVINFLVAVDFLCPYSYPSLIFFLSTWISIYHGKIIYNIRVMFVL